MPSLRRILRYISHYGLRSTAGLVYEKLVIDKRRFSPNKKRRIPSFSTEKGKYAPSPVRTAPKEDLRMTLMYLIHYFYPNKKGGTERFTLNLAIEQKKLGNRPIVLVLEANEPLSAYSESCGENILLRTYEYEGIECIGFRHKKAPLGLYYKAIDLTDGDMKLFAEYITGKYSVDLVHAVYPQPFASFLLACFESGIAYAVTCTDFCMLCHYSTMVDGEGNFCISAEGGRRCAEYCRTFGCSDFKKRKANAEKILSCASFVTVPSDFVADILGAEFPAVDFMTVPHGIPEDFKFRKRVGGARKFVFAGTLSMLKGVHLLLEAFASVSLEDISLDIYGEGDGRYISGLKAMAGERVRFMGAASPSDMPSIYADADCIIVPSMWYETYNFVLREALATGALAVCADIGAMPEAINEGENGFLFTPADKQSLALAIKRAAEFDFAFYRPCTFPTPRDEAIVYLNLYKDAAEK